MKSAADILSEMRETFIERNKVYGDNYLAVGKCMEVLFPKGVVLNGADDFMVWHLFELLIVKITRFSFSDLTHKDSIHDAAVYCAMVEEAMGRVEGCDDPECSQIHERKR